MKNIKINAENNSPIITIEREFAAIPEKVFRIFSEKDFVAKWWNPMGNAVVEELDFKEGGKWSFSSDAEAGKITFHGFFHEISYPKRFVQTSEFDNLAEMIGDRGHTVLAKYEFEPVGENHTKLKVTEVYMSVDDRDNAIASDMEPGLTESYNKIDKVLEELN